MPLFKKELNPEDRTLFLRQLAMLCEYGLTLPQAIGRLSESNESTAVAVYCRRLMEGMEGQGLNALSQTHPMLSVLARLTEKSTSAQLLSQSLYEMADVNETTAGYRKAMAAAIAYPAKLLLVALMFWIIAMIFVIPVFEELFGEFENQLPAATQFLLTISRWVQDNILYMLVGIGLFIALCAAAPRVRAWTLWLMPSLRTVVRSNIALHFCHLLAILTRFGLPLPDAIQLTIAALPASTFSRQFKRIDSEAKDLAGFKTALKDTNVLPKSVLALVEVIDRVESLPSAFGQFTNYLSKVFNSQLTRAYKDVEISIFIATAIVIGAMVIALYLPIFHMAGAIGG
ncbi:MAG: type II secretion system F family protein [Desulfobacterales bacterium]|nr:type II secretion system F family protein [Desulfobacterales bacterium]MBI5896088.1 type II secretion system F family protein [Desulfobacterales bacterium]